MKICGRHARHYRRKTMLYMVIERFKEGAAPEIYRRFREKGRMMPEGLEYVSSWIDLDFKICYQLMRTEDFALFDKWIDNWRDLMEFEIIPVRSSTEAAEVMNKKL
jgi:hypothetical protein